MNEDDLIPALADLIQEMFDSITADGLTLDLPDADTITQTNTTVVQ